MFQDKNIDLARKRLILDTPSFNGLAPNGRTLTGTAANVELLEISSFGYAGLDFKHDDGRVRFGLMLPDEIDTFRPIGVTLQWITESRTPEHVVEWKVLVKSVGIGDRLTSAFSDTNDALDTPIEEQDVSYTTEFTFQETSRGVIRGGRFNRGDFLIFDIEADVTGLTLGTEELFLVGLILDYMPKFTRGPGARLDRPYEPNQVDYKY